MAIGDLNGDGIRDLAIANNYYNNVDVMLGLGDGTFSPQVTYDSGGIAPDSLAIGDLNGDGLPDIAVANSTSNNVGVLRVSRAGRLRPRRRMPPAASFPSRWRLGT